MCAGPAVVEREIRARVSTRSSDSGVLTPGVGHLPGVVHSKASSSKSGVRDTVGRVSRESDGGGQGLGFEKERGAARGGASLSNKTRFSVSTTGSTSTCLLENADQRESLFSRLSHSHPGIKR